MNAAEIKGLWQSLQSESWATAWLSEDIRECVSQLLETLVIAEAERRHWEHISTDEKGCEKCTWGDEPWQADVRKEWGME
jgi:hypothetical protein